MVDEINNIKDRNGFKVNEEEEKDVQIEEFVLAKNAPGWYRSMMQLYMPRLTLSLKPYSRDR